MHSFGMTKNYVVFAEYPFVVNPKDLLLSGKPFIENFTWKPDRGTTFLVFDKSTGKLRGRYKTDAFFAFHHINAFEEGGDMIVDLVTYPDVAIVNSLYLDALRGEAGKYFVSAGEFRRYRIDLADGHVAAEVITKMPLELPRINYKSANAKNYRFVYGAGSTKENPEEFLDKLVKIDIVDRKEVVWQQQDCYPGEPVFVPAPGAHREDEGVILSIVLDVANENSFLLILDAHSFEQLAVAKVPHHIPFGFHGQYFGGHGS
jgi:carotenoid cleavage dioxygenase-like enzyme